MTEGIRKPRCSMWVLSINPSFCSLMLPFYSPAVPTLVPMLQRLLFCPFSDLRPLHWARSSRNQGRIHPMLTVPILGHGLDDRSPCVPCLGHPNSLLPGTAQASTLGIKMQLRSGHLWDAGRAPVCQLSWLHRCTRGPLWKGFPAGG
jgi:hypothetical protein